jgi:hypothetical protein
VIVLIAVTSGLLSVLLAVAVNVATGGVLPGPLAAVSWLAWPAVGVLGGVGVWLTIWQQRLGDDDAPGPREVPARAPRPAELPAQSMGFAGRGEDLATVDRILAGGCRVLVLVGPPGVGKSALALHVAYQRRVAFGDGQLFAALRGASDPVPPENVLNRFLGALGVPEDERRGGADDLAARFRSTVADRKLLLVLDDARDAQQVRPLLPAGAGCLVLVTSRRLITELTGAVIHRLGGLDEADGRALLASVAGTERVDADPDGADRIVRLCGGLPLAVRIAGSRLRARPTWTVADLARRLSDDHHRLDELRVGDVAVRSTFATSYRELSTVDRQVFRRAGAHPGSSAPAPRRRWPGCRSRPSPPRWSGSSTPTSWRHPRQTGTGCTTSFACSPSSGSPRTSHRRTATRALPVCCGGTPHTPHAATGSRSSGTTWSPRCARPCRNAPSSRRGRW